MSKTQQVSYILLCFAAIIFLPLIGSYIHHNGVFPDGFFQYPMLAAKEKAPFSWLVFGIVAAGGFLVILLYLFPSLFGFKKQPVPQQPKVIKVKWPLWLWIGIFSLGSSLVLLWSKSTWPTTFLHWSDFPLFWGLVLVLDGWTYIRNGGKSIISERPQEMVGIGVSSAMGWMLFEYLNFFVDDNWFYPFGDIIDREQFLLYAIVISTGLLPLSFVFYSLFNTFTVLKNRYTVGPKIILSETIKSVLIVISLLSLIGSGLFPNELFFSLWLTPAILIGLVLDKLGIWTPIRSIGQGNWRPTLVFALTYLAAGLCLECENYFSGVHDGQTITFTEAPAYWQYNLPYVNDFHLFEMPILGFFGYMPFGIYVWLWWIAFAYMQGIPSVFYKEEPFEPNTTT
ncbi:MAG: hypothetical protein IPM42_20535 [Saprospiraceae bacterium]|nr:hypothetical protein [Saprospiraceae bacterium]